MTHPFNPHSRRRSIHRSAVIPRERACADPFPGPRTAPPAEQFETLLADEVRSPLLRYSDRLRLLREAAALGVKPFEANLILAQAVLRAEQIHPPETRWTPWLIAGAVQTCILAVACYLFLPR